MSVGKIFSGAQKVMKFHFSFSKLRKRPFATNVIKKANFKIQRTLSPASFRRPWFGLHKKTENNCSNLGLYNMQPAGRMRPTKAFPAARESFLNCRKCCKSSTSNKQLSFQKFFHTTTKSTHRNEIDFCVPRQFYVDNSTLRAF